MDSNEFVGQTNVTVQALKDMLDGVVTIVFTKVSTGEQRTMKCTTNLEKIDKQFHPASKRQTSTTTMRVFDLEKNSWRSFYPSNVVSITA